MTGIFVDQDLCTRCGICSIVFPLSIIDPADERSLPQVQDARAESCIRCGHCEVSCPLGALTLDFLTDEKESIAGSGEISPASLGTYLKTRRSVRHFTGTAVEKEKIAQILDIVRYAASGGNGHPVQWLVIHDRKEVQRIAGLTIDWLHQLAQSQHPMKVYAGRLVAAWKNGYDRICWNAPHLLFAHIPENNPVAPTDAIIALTHFDIAAPSFGVGTCWAGFVSNAALSWEPLRKVLALPEGRKVAYAMMFGYPQYKIYGIPRRNPVQVTWG